MRTRLSTASCCATSTCWPSPVRSRCTSAARMPMAQWSPAPVLQIERDAPLVGVEQKEEPRVRVGPLREHAPPRLASRRLDLDHVGAEPREHLGAARSRLVLREVEDHDPVEGLAHLSSVGAGSDRYVVYAEKRIVCARALSSVTTLTTAGLPDAHARSSAGRISWGFSTYSPCAPKSWATLS